MITSYTSLGGNAGVCKYDTIHKNQGGIDYNRANSVFSSIDVNHSRSITFSGAYQGLHILVPGASEQMIDALTKNGDKNKDGKIDYSEFIAMYRGLVDELQSRGKTWNKCYNSPCRKNQMCRNCRNSKGYCCEDISTGFNHPAHVKLPCRIVSKHPKLCSQIHE